MNFGVRNKVAGQLCIVQFGKKLEPFLSSLHKALLCRTECLILTIREKKISIIYWEEAETPCPSSLAD